MVPLCQRIVRERCSNPAMGKALCLATYIFLPRIDTDAHEAVCHSTAVGAGSACALLDGFFVVMCPAAEFGCSAVAAARAACSLDGSYV